VPCRWRFVESSSSSLLFRHFRCSFCSFSGWFCEEASHSSSLLSFVFTQFYLTNVLYSPSFKLNLMSFHKLSESLSCFFQFLPNQCIIQDSTSLKMIGLASQQDGLYKFHDSSISTNKVQSSLASSACTIPVSCNSSTVIPNKAIWHFRLWHLSHQRLNMMSSLYSNIVSDNKNYVCDICHFAK